MNEIQRFRRTIVRELKRIDPRWNPAEESFRAGMVLLASIGVGPNVPDLVTVTGLPESFVTVVLKRCRKAGIWRGQRLRAEWFEEECGGFSALLDACVAGGLFTRSCSPETKSKQATVSLRRII